MWSAYQGLMVNTMIFVLYIIMVFILLKEGIFMNNLCFKNRCQLFIKECEKMTQQYNNGIIFSVIQYDKYFQKLGITNTIDKIVEFYDTQYTGNADLPMVHGVPIPIIANGDIRDAAGVERVKELGYSGAMIGRAMLGRPWLLGVLDGCGAAPENVGVIVLQHLEYMCQYYGNKNAIPMFRKHVAWYSAGYPNSADFRIRINQITDVKQLKIEICKFWGCEGNI